MAWPGGDDNGIAMSAGRADIEQWVLWQGGNVRKYGRLAAAGALMATVAAGALCSPAQAATNPYTPQEACNHQFGGTWTTTSDGHRSLTALGSHWGDVYLMYNSATGYNCVATIKAVYVGTSSETEAGLSIEGDNAPWGYDDLDSYKYYAATEGYAAGKCVRYRGTMYSPTSSDNAANGRYTWGNCG